MSDAQQKIVVGGANFDIDKHAKPILEHYLASLAESFSSNENKDEILSGMSSRIAEHLTSFTKTSDTKVVTVDHVIAVMKKMGTVDEVKEETKAVVPEPSRTNFRSGLRKFAKAVAYTLYWIPHVFWLLSAVGWAFILFGYVFAGPEKVTFTTFLTYAGVFILPTIGVGVGAYLHVKGKFRSMLLFFLGVEIPLFLLSSFKIFVVTVYSPIISFMLFLIIIACITLTLELIESVRLVAYKRFFGYFNIVGYSIGTLMSGYVFAIWIFFAPGVFKMLFEGIIEFFQYSLSPFSNNGGMGVIGVFYSPLMIIGFFYCLLLFMSPVYAFIIYFRKLVRTIKKSTGISITRSENKSIKIDFSPEQSRIAAVNKILLVPFTIILSIVMITLLSIDFYASRKVEISKTLENTYEVDKSYSDIKAEYLLLYKNEFLTRNAIVSQFIARYQYLIDDNSDNIFNDLYCPRLYNGYDYRGGIYDESYNRVASPREMSCNSLYHIFKLLITPVVYHGDLEEDYKFADDAYKKVFDESIQRDQADKIKKYTANTFGESLLGSSRFGSSNWTTLVDEDENRVNLTNLDIESEINTKDNLYETTYTLTLKNKELTQQEAFIEFSIPEGSVVNDLKLGVDLENPGLVAPKAAAKNVYTNSVRRSIDPALLELVGPRTYRLRIFPIPSREPETRRVWDERERRDIKIEIPNYQKVYFSIAGIFDGTLPVTNFSYTRNLDISSNTDLKIYLREAEDRDFSFSSIENKFDITNVPDKPSYHFELDYKGKTSDFIRNGLEENLIAEKINVCMDDSNYGIKPSDIQKVRIFVDVSKSAEGNLDNYRNFIKGLDIPVQNYDLYEFNFMSNKLGENLSHTEVFDTVNIAGNIKFWGYSDKSNVVKEIFSQTDEKTVTFILTDDSDFEMSPEINYDVNYSQNKNNTVHLIQFGDRLTAQKEELNNLIFASNGRTVLIKKIDKNNEFDYSVFFDDCLSPDEIVSDGNKWSDIRMGIVTFNKNREEIAQITSSIDRVSVARGTTTRAKAAHIIDPFNSMIAVEFDWQKQNLIDASDDDDAYNEDFDIGEGDLILPQMMGASLPEASVNFSVGVIAMFVVYLIVMERRKVRVISG